MQMLLIQTPGSFLIVGFQVCQYCVLIYFNSSLIAKARCNFSFIYYFFLRKNSSSNYVTYSKRSRQTLIGPLGHPI